MDGYENPNGTLRKNRRLKFRIKKGIPRAPPSVEHVTCDDLRSYVQNALPRSRTKKTHRALHSNE